LRTILRSGPQPSRDRRDVSYRRPLVIPAERVQAFRDRRSGKVTVRSE
jgi:hypothetical protein